MRINTKKEVSPSILIGKLSRYLDAFMTDETLMP